MAVRLAIGHGEIDKGVLDGESGVLFEPLAMRVEVQGALACASG